MKRSHLISAILFLFVVYATRVDIYIDTIFSENFTTELVEPEHVENGTDEKGKKESKDDDPKGYFFLRNKFTLRCNYQFKLKAVATCQKLACPAIDLEFPPPKV